MASLPQHTMSMPDPFPIPCALTIAGSDSGGGAGIQADLKSFAALGVHGLSVVAALTAQHTRGVSAVHVPPVAFLRAQIDACFDDFTIVGVKLGMLANAEIIHHVADALEHYRPRYIVLDPVMVATSGAKLLEDSALDALRQRLLPLASVLTPNIPEAELLLGRAISNDVQAHTAAIELAQSGAAVLLKGGHLAEGEQVIDRYIHGDTATTFHHPRLHLEAHGTGCTLAAAITAQLCNGKSLLEACQNATDYVARALAHGYCPGRSTTRVLQHCESANV